VFDVSQYQQEEYYSFVFGFHRVDHAHRLLAYMDSITVNVLNAFIDSGLGGYPAGVVLQAGGFSV
jgi:hypothetical protein